MKSIRFSFWRRRKHKTDAVQRSLQGLSAGQSAAQMTCRNNLVTGSASALANNSAGNQFNNHHATINGMGGRNVEVDKRCCGVSDDLDRLNSKGGVNNIFSGHRSVLLYINESGEAYDLSGQKWSRL
jgi:hypothetical protein